MVFSTKLFSVPMQDSHLLELNANAIEQVKAGLSLGQTLQLPQEVTFSLDHMSTLFVTNEELFIRPLHQLRLVIQHRVYSGTPLNGHP